ncbi:SGNH/GDSL hydrolase family protein [Candidatus Saccharibacteria bacterium]|nr:MAG: SGNH/GDSL hydrolase family protein [Candidatus Saccharibacteria bacterium]
MKHNIIKRLALGFGALVVVLPSMSGIAAAQTAPSTEAPTGKYVALGDSVAAGAGLPTGPNSGDAQCQRSSQAYAYGVAEAANLQLKHVACGGATADDMFTTQQVGNATIRAQLDAAFEGGTPDLITITVGANDMRWSDFLKVCLSDQNCDNRWYGYTVDALLVGLRAKLAYTLASIDYRSHGDKTPKVIITGYYNPVSQACTGPIRTLSSGEVNWISGQINKLNRTIQSTTGWYSFAKYAPVDFSGHDICSGRSWIQGVGWPAPFHPSADGQKAMAAAVAQKL